MTLRQLRIATSLALATTLGVVVWAHTARASAASTDLKPVSIAIDNFSFGMASIEVPKGTQVTWTNRDDVPHTVTSTEKRFKSGMLDTDDSFSFTFNETGTFGYFCSLHPKMTGKIVVK